MAFFDNDDLNGSCFIAGELGEIEELLDHRRVHFDNSHPSAQVPGTRTQFSDVQAVAFIEYNFGASITARAAQTPPVTLTVAEAASIAYLRFLGARTGLISPRFDPANYHVTYNDARAVDYAQNAVQIMTAPPYERPTGHAANQVIAPISTVLTIAVRRNLRANFTNIVCCVAYMFRVRGHHYVADMEAKYNSLWSKCLKEGDNPGLRWEYVAHDALHAIMPAILDNYWRDMVLQSNVAGALQKRFDSAPAGVAGVKALQSGMQDLAVTVPGFKALHRDLYDDLDRAIVELQNNRWAGSINRRFYGAGDLNFVEARFAGIASTIIAALEQFATGSKLKESKALLRMASAAPISGGFTAKLIAAAANDPRNAQALVLAGTSSSAPVAP